MNHLPYRAIALDLDGTLTNHDKVVTPKTREALLQAEAEGVVIILASGRPTYGIEPVAECLELDKRGGYILSSDGLTTTGVYATSAFTDPVTGSLFLCVNDKIVKWDAGLVGQFQWRSRKQGVVVPTNFSYGQVLSTAYPVTMNVYADGVISNTVTVANDQPFRLSSGFRARYWEIELLGSGFVSFVSIADTVEELQRV